MPEQRPGTWSRLKSWLSFSGRQRAKKDIVAAHGEKQENAVVPALEDIDLDRLPPLFPDPETQPVLAELKANAQFLRSPPRTAIQILNLTADENASIHDLERLITGDAALSTAILRVANSAAFHTGSKVDNILRAITVLGFEEIQNVAITTSALTSFDMDDGQMSRLAEHGMEVGLLARHITYEREGLDAGMAFACGVLHDLGKQALLAARGPSYSELLTRQGEFPNAMHLVEDDELGVDHAQVGALVLLDWEFPDQLVAVTGLHHRLEELYGEEGLEGLQWLLAAIKLADHYSYLLGETDQHTPEMLEALHRSEPSTLIGFDIKDIERLWVELQRVLIQTGKIFNFDSRGAPASDGNSRSF